MLLLTVFAMSPRLEGQLFMLLETLLGGVLLLLIMFASFYLGRLRESLTGALARKFHNPAQLRPLTAAAHAEISNAMRDLRAQFKASRVCLFQFHNGSSFMMANHAWKVSCSHEAITSGVEPTSLQNQELRVGAIIDWIHPLLNEDYDVPGVKTLDICVHGREDCTHGRKGQKVVYYDVNTMEMSVGQSIANRQNVHHVFAVTLLDVDHKSVIGMLAVQFADITKEQVAAAEAQICALCPVAEKIQFYLTTDYSDYRAKPGFFSWLRRKS